MKSLLKNAVFAISLSLGAATVMAVPTLSVQAAVPTDESLRELVAVTKFSETIEQMSSKDSVQKMVTDSLSSTFITDEMTDIKRQKLTKIFSNYSNNIFDDEYIETFNKAQVQAYIDAMKKHLTQEEVNAQIDFYNSKAGKSIVEKQPIMMQDYANDIRSITEKKITDELKIALPILMKELKALGINK